MAAARDSRAGMARNARAAVGGKGGTPRTGLSADRGTRFAKGEAINNARMATGRRAASPAGGASGDTEI